MKHLCINENNQCTYLNTGYVGGSRREQRVHACGSSVLKRLPTLHIFVCLGFQLTSPSYEDIPTSLKQSGQMSRRLIISTAPWHGADESDAFDPPFCGYVVRVEVLQMCGQAMENFRI